MANEKPISKDYLLTQLKNYETEIINKKYIEKEDGKGLSSNDYTTEEKNKLAGLENYNDTALSNRVKSVEDEIPNLATKTYVGEQIANSEHLKREIVTVLPSDEEASDNIIYMLKVESATGNDKYQEYMKIDGTVQMVGDTSVDLTDYAKTADVNTELGKKVNTTDIVDSLVSDATDKPLSAAQGKALDGKKVDKVDGMALSSNDYTDEEKSLVATIEDKVDKTSIATVLDDTVTDEQVASALLAKTELDKKIDKTSIVTELSEESTDDKVVGALTAYNELQKLESANKEQFATASGDFITVNDSVDGNIVELGIKGKSEQKQYTGKNLFDCNTMFPFGTNNGITVTNNGDGSYTLSGTATGISQMGKGLNHEQTLAFFNHGAGTYTISTQESPSVKASVFQCNLIKYNGTDSDYSWQINMGYKTKSYTITQDMLDNESFTISFQYFVGNGVTINQTFFPQVEFGSEATEYEPYVGGTSSPNPSYPQTINSVGDDGELVVKSRGKNLIPYPYDNGVRTSAGLTMTSLPNGMVNVNGTNTGASGLFNFNYPTRSLIKLDPSKTYAFFNPLKTDVENQITLGIRWYLESDEISINTGTNTNIAIHGNSNGAVIRSGFSYAYVYLYGHNSGKTFNNVLFAPMLVEVNEDGTYPTEYEIYKSSTSTIPLSEPLRSIGDIKDEITYQNGKWGILRRIKEINLTDLAWELVNNGTYQYWRYSVNDGKEASSYNTIANIIAEKYMASSWYNTVQLNSATNAIAYGFNANNTSSKLIAVHNGSTTESPTGKFLYELVTPTFEPFADQTLPYLSTYDGVTNISNDDALSAEMTVKYPTTDASGIGSRNENRIAKLTKDTDDSLSVIGKCKNLLNPTLQTTTKNGVTCTNNGDGTYTLNGTASADTYFNITSQIEVEIGKKYKLCCTTSDDRSKYNAYMEKGLNGFEYSVLTASAKTAAATISVHANVQLNDTLIKPMLTTDLSATYDDFVPYTGDGETLTHDVAKLNDKVGKTDIATTIDGKSTDTQVPSAKAVWNKSKNKIQRLLDGVDIIVYADSISHEMVTDTVRIMNATNSPYGVDNVNNDFHYTIYNVNDDKYKRILAYDIRKNDMYMIVKNNNIWGAWAKLATTDNLGGLTFSASGTTLSITDGTNTWTLEANS